MTCELWLVDRDILDTSDAVVVDVENLVNQQEWIAVWQLRHNLVDIHQRSLRWAILEGWLLTIATDSE